MENTNISSYYIDIPKSDLAFFRSMTKRMGWNIKRRQIHSQSELNETTLRSIKDVKAGKTYKARSAKEMIALLNS